jgi:hypothetical protein
MANYSISSLAGGREDRCFSQAVAFLQQQIYPREVWLVAGYLRPQSTI